MYISISRLFGQRPSDGAAVFPIPVFFAVCLHQSLTCLLIPDEENKKKIGPILPFSFPPAIFCLSCDAGILLAKSTVCAFDTKRRYKSPRNFEFREIQNFDAKQVKNSGFRVDLVDKTRAA